MESLPFPYERFEAGKGTIYYESIRGTSDRSVYSQHLPDARVRTLSLGRICTEIRYFLACEAEKVVFLDRWFNYNSERAYRIFEYIIHNDNGVTSFEFNINGDELDDETLRLLSEARNGQIILNVDLASTNSEVLAAIGRNEIPQSPSSSWLPPFMRSSSLKPSSPWGFSGCPAGTSNMVRLRSLRYSRSL